MPEYSVWYPATSSVSASGRSNGGRFVSAIPAMKKTTRPTNCGPAYQIVSCCFTAISTSESEPLSVLGVVIMSGSLSLVEIAVAQQETIWYAGPQFVGLVVFFIAGIAETNRPPFDLPEADTELVAGYQTEYGGMRFGLFSMAEYINMITLSGLAVTLFFGAWGGPVLPGPIWFLIKLAGFIFVFMWLRATLPRLRYDQLMSFGWKVLLPVATINAVVTAVLGVAL